MNVISSLLVGLKTPKNAFERCLYKDALARSRLRNASQLTDEDVLFACGACAAKQARDCICSGIASLHGNVNLELLSEFTSGIRSPENPVYEPLDPDDQRKLQESLEKGEAVLLSLRTSRRTSLLVRCRHLVRLMYVAAMSGLAATVEAAAPFLAAHDLRGLRHYLDTAEVVHRGGQHPGKVCRGNIAVQLVPFMRAVGNKMARLLSSCTSSLQTVPRRQVLLSLVQLNFQLASKREYDVDGCGAYKWKNNRNHVAGWAQFQTDSAAVLVWRPPGFVWSVAGSSRITRGPATDHARHDHEDSRTAGFESDIFDTRLRR